MQRKPWFEIHDHPRFPSFLRNLVTEALEAMWGALNVYRSIVPTLKHAMETVDSHEVVDLCSGGGGPWLGLQQDLTAAGYPVLVHLTDLYPNQRAFDKVSQQSLHTITSYSEPVDATCPPEGFTGFRTIFSSFHHFDPQDARAVLADSFHRNEGLAIFDAAERSIPVIAGIFFLPLFTLILAPGIRPFRWSRLLWTYLLPVIPIVIGLDGILSCLRSYSRTDLAELTKGLNSENYSWKIGRVGDRFIRITYLIGMPIAVSD